ncbi:MAG: hypothetical protein RLZZ176_2852 [Cyanobacteriota bacterium]|jgi:hypothetical protein
MAEVLIGKEAEGRRQAEPLHPCCTSSQVNVIEDYDI